MSIVHDLGLIYSMYKMTKQPKPTSKFPHISQRSNNTDTRKGESHASNTVWDSEAGFNLRTVFLQSLGLLCHIQYGKLQDCSSARRRNNHCRSKFICFAIPVHFRKVVWHLASEMFSYTLITTPPRPFVCLLKNAFPYMYGNLQKAHAHQQWPTESGEKY